MITLRLTIDEVNGIHQALEDAKAFVEEEDVAPISAIVDKIKEQAEKDVSSWDGYVINEVNSVLELLIPEADSGNIGITYDKVVKEMYETGPVYEPGLAKGVSINVVLTFPDTIKVS
jgi:hypothetical protein